MKKRNKIYFLKIIALSSLLFFCLFLFEAKTSKAALGTAACNAKGGSCDVTCISSDYESLGMCDYGVLICCKKKLVDTSGADLDPAGKGNFGKGSCSGGNGTCKLSVAIGGTICGDDKNIGQDICSWGYSCCVPTTNTGVGSTNPTTANPTTGASPAVPGAAGTGAGGSPATVSGARTGSTGGLVPCTDDCTLCHLVLGFKNIYDYLLVLLLSATTLVVVVAGVMYMVSSGDKGMIDKAKSALTYALTAMILALTAWLIINATLNALGFKNAGSWYNFTCDTAQTQGPTGGTGGGTLPGTGQSVTNTEKGDGNCGGTKNLVEDKDNCGTTSKRLDDVLACVKGRVMAFDYEKGADNNMAVNFWNEFNPFYEVAFAAGKMSIGIGTNVPGHMTNSCHYGGRNCQGQAQAADLSGSDLVALQNAAIECGADTVIHNGKSYSGGNSKPYTGKNPHTGHVHMSVNNATCGCG